MKKFGFLVVIVLFYTGCSSHHVKKSIPRLELTPLKEARVFQEDKLNHGGNLLVVPFSAGPDVIASDELDHVSLEIVKGISDVLEAKGKPFKILAGNNAQNADLVIKGRILRMENQGRFTKFKEHLLSVEGMVIAVDNEQILAKFLQNKKSRSRNDNFRALGYQIGVEIGQFLLSTSD